MSGFRQLKTIYPVCSGLLPHAFWQRLEEQNIFSLNPADFPEQVCLFIDETDAPGYLADLARAEWTRHQKQQSDLPSLGSASEISLNPTLTLLEVDWSPLLPIVEGKEAVPERSGQILAFWRDPGSGQTRQAVARSSDLLALKVVAEKLDPLDVANGTGQPVGVIDGAIERAASKGLLLAPPSRIQRSEDDFPIAPEVPEKYLRAEVFTLQWHITQRCDLNCLHCYDRSSRFDVEYQKGIETLDQLRAFCLARNVSGQVSFSGGNPCLHPQFMQLYQAARDRNFNVAILGNPISEAQLDQILDIATPAFYQVSLEGLQPHNDSIRGKGNFESVLTFLDLLKSKKIFSMVMLTLTRANMDQVLELTEQLRDRVDLFTYNRLSMVGEGANLETPGRDEYHAFVQQYLQARKNNPALALKDSLLNIEKDQLGQQLFGGCTGFGCGAAFNFVSLLPDGEVHACRKFPSRIGHIHKQSLEEIYDSEAARSYRRGCQGCSACHLRPVCGGCLAVAYGWGLDPLKEKDPACFLPHDDL